METGPDGTLRLREAPPVLQHVDEEIEAPLLESIEEYLAAVPADIALLLSHFRITDVALRVVGVGSVGTRCYLVILVGPNDTPLILQIKEATRSVLDEFGGWPQPDSLTAAVEAKGQGVRVVDGQQILQAMSDVFLGTTRKDGRDYYVRQFHDMKGTVETEGMSAGHVQRVRQRVCGAAGARALAERERVNTARIRRHQRQRCTARSPSGRTPTPTSRSTTFTNCERRPRPATSRSPTILPDENRVEPQETVTRITI